jgi:S-adenosylmethionine hydrolase
MQPDPVFLMTDFGTEDPYVGLMKSVLIEKRPAPSIVDLTHEVAPQNEVNAAFLLEYVLPDLPENSVLLLVVDPKVGTARDIIAVETTGSNLIVAPDTGLVDGLEWKRAHHVENPELSRTSVSSTFHGRDWFAPVGRFLSRGGDLTEVGETVSHNDRERIVPEPELDAGGLSGEIVHVDHFGNLISNISRGRMETFLGENLKGSVSIRIGGRTLEQFVDTYDDATGLTALFGSFDCLEVAVPSGAASNTLNASIGSTITLRAK